MFLFAPPFIKEAVEDSAPEKEAFAATSPGAGTWGGVCPLGVAVMVPHGLPGDGCCALEDTSLPAAMEFPKQDWGPNVIIM